MPRRLRVSTGGYVYHVLNRAVGRNRIFDKPWDFEAFEEVIERTKVRLSMRILAWCVMPNHWHFVLWPHGDGDLSEFMRWLTVTHTQRWHSAHHTAGSGPLYQGRFKSFPIQEDEHLWAVLQYVEQNPMRANIVQQAEAWRWSSLWHRMQGDKLGLLDDGPLALPCHWLQHVQTPQTEAELKALRRSVVRSCPFGEASWQEKAAKKLHLESTLRPRGRPWPKKQRENIMTPDPYKLIL
jgi:putative transposase